VRRRRGCGRITLILVSIPRECWIIGGRAVRPARSGRAAQEQFVGASALRGHAIGYLPRLIILRLRLSVICPIISVIKAHPSVHIGLLLLLMMVVLGMTGDGVPSGWNMTIPAGIVVAKRHCVVLYRILRSADTLAPSSQGGNGSRSKGHLDCNC
jgi:hypothetical protein